MNDHFTDEQNPRAGGRNLAPRSGPAVLVVLVLGVSLASARAGEPSADGPPPKAKFGHKRKKDVQTRGTLGYGPPGLFPGFPGFGLRYHPGYGFGGYGLGTMAEGGFPHYAGTGYPHPSPPLNRFGKILPTTYLGGPRGPNPGCPNFFAPVDSLLVVDSPTAALEDLGMGLGQGTDYGCYTGGLPAAEARFAPFASAEAAGAPSGVGDDRPPAPPLAAPPPFPASRGGQALGVSVIPAGPLDVGEGLLLSRVERGSAAERAGLRPGDVLRSIDGKPLKTADDLSRALEASPAGPWTLRLRSGADGQEREISVRTP